MTVPTRLVAVLRLVAAGITLVAVTATYLDSAARAIVNPFNFFGFFTIQSNVLAAVVLATTAVLTLAGRRAPDALVLARAAVTAYMVVVGVVYNTLLTGVPGGVELAWANTVMHVLFPVYCLLDWALVRDRAAPPWRRLCLVLVYPVLWCAVVLLRGATDGWVPYPFLNPVTGYGSVAFYVFLIAAAFVLAGAGVFALGRLRPVRPRG